MTVPPTRGMMGRYPEPDVSRNVYDSDDEDTRRLAKPKRPVPVWVWALAAAAAVVVASP